MKVNGDGKHQALDGGWGWVVVFGSFLSHALLAALYYAYGVFTQEWIIEFEATSAMASMVGSMSAAFTSMSAPLGSIVQHRWGCRCSHMIGGIMVTLGTLLSSRASSLIQIFIFYGVLGGTGLGFCYVPAVISLSQYFKQKRPVAMGIASSGVGVGSFLFPIIIEYMQEEYGWRGSMLILSAIMGNMCVVAMVFFPITHFHLPKKKPTALKLQNGREVTKPAPSSNGDVTPLNDDVFDGDVTTQVDVVNEKGGLCEKTEPGGKARKSSFSVVRNLVRHPWLRRKSSLAVPALREGRELQNQRADLVMECLDEKSLENLSNSRELQLTSSRYDITASRLTNLAASTLTLKQTFTAQLRLLVCNPLFYLMTVNNVTMFIGMMLVYGLTPVRAISIGFTTAQGAAFVSGIGFANLVGRFSWGALSNVFPRSNPIVWFVWLRILAAALTLLSPLATSYALQMTYCVLVGLMFGAWSLYPLVLAKMFGDDCLGAAFGFLEFFDGVGCIIGPTLGGFLFDLTGSYQASFIMGGAVLAVGTFIVALGSYMLRKTMPN